MIPATRKDKYETVDATSDSLEELTKKFSQDLRKHIKRIVLHPVFTRDWLEMEELLEHINKIAQMEQQKHQSAKKQESAAASQTAGKNALSGIIRPMTRAGSLIIGDGQGSVKKHAASVDANASSSSLASSSSSQIDKTLWDKEEYCIRFIVEEGKVNVLLRYLTDFKKIQAQVLDGSLKLEPYAAQIGMTTDELSKKMRQFEEAAGLLVDQCFEAKEAIQTCDIPHLMNHIELVLTNALRSSFTVSDISGFKGLQEVLVFSYLCHFFRRLDSIASDAIITSIVDKQLFATAIQFLKKYGTQLSQADQLICAEALSLIIDADFFKPQYDAIFSINDVKQNFISLNDIFVKSLLTNYETKKKLRALTDLIIMLK